MRREYRCVLNKWPIVLIALNPILTGFVFLMWGKAGTLHPAFGPMCNLLSAAVALCLILLFESEPVSFRGDAWTYIGLYIIANAIVNITLVYTLKFYSVSIISKIEIAYPFFVIIFSWLLYNTTGMNVKQFIGACIAFTGMALMVWQ